MYVTSSLSRYVRAVATTAVLAVGACTHSGITYTLYNENNGDSLSVVVGDEISVYLGTVGPGSYLDSVSISAPILTYRPTPWSGPVTPAGANTEYHFHAVWPGSVHVVIPWAEQGTVYPARAFAFDVRVGGGTPSN